MRSHRERYEKVDGKAPCPLHDADVALIPNPLAVGVLHMLTEDAVSVMGKATLEDQVTELPVGLQAQVPLGEPLEPDVIFTAKPHRKVVELVGVVNDTDYVVLPYPV